MDLTTDFFSKGSCTVLKLAGEIDLHTAPKLTEQLVRLCEGGRKDVVVDLAEVGFLDSSALGALIAGQRAISAEGGTLKLARARPHVLKVFVITRLTDVLPVYQTLEEACA